MKEETVRRNPASNGEYLHKHDLENTGVCDERRHLFLYQSMIEEANSNQCSDIRKGIETMERWMKVRFGADLKDERVRRRWGKAASIAGIAVNVLLFAGKLAAGLFSGSVAITADALNNLSDSSSGIVSLLGFKLAEKPADAEHPYGHGRFEYLSGLTVAVMILVIGVELLKSSVEKIFTPSPVAMSLSVVLILSVSIVMKIGLAGFNRKIGRLTGSNALMASADDSRNDVISTAAVLISTAIGHFTGWMIDGWAGAAVAVFILISGFGLVKDTVDPMIGAIPSKEMVYSVRRRLLSYPGVLGIHDLMIHDYGPGRQYASVHLEMDAGEDPLAAHDLIDSIERDFMEKSGLHMVIHHDPVATGDPRVAVMKEVVSSIVAQIDPRLTIHDLRIVPGHTYTNIVFDCVVPYDLDMNEELIRARICRAVITDYPDYRCMITMEHSFV